MLILCIACAGRNQARIQNHLAAPRRKRRWRFDLIPATGSRLPWVYNNNEQVTS
jgi:Uri superfamily endonuclease